MINYPPSIKATVDAVTEMEDASGKPTTVYSIKVTKAYDDVPEATWNVVRSFGDFTENLNGLHSLGLLKKFHFSNRNPINAIIAIVDKQKRKDVDDQIELYLSEISLLNPVPEIVVQFLALENARYSGHHHGHHHHSKPYLSVLERAESLTDIGNDGKHESQPQTPKTPQHLGSHSKESMEGGPLTIDTDTQLSPERKKEDDKGLVSSVTKTLSKAMNVDLRLPGFSSKKRNKGAVRKVFAPISTDKAVFYIFAALCIYVVFGVVWGLVLCFHFIRTRPHVDLGKISFATYNEDSRY